MSAITERSWNNRDKSTWPAGPWQQEPDKVQWLDDATGLDCLAVRNHSGAWCGYVGVPEGHPFFGVDYDKCYLPCSHDHSAEADEDDGWFYCGDRYIEVHGGLTFSDFCREGAEEDGICHIPFEGRPDRVWWLGFDCAHSHDVVPRYLDRLRYGPSEYRDLPYVRDQVSRLAAQLAAIAVEAP